MKHDRNLSERDRAALLATFDGQTVVTYKPRLIRTVDALPDGSSDVHVMWRRRGPQVLKQRPALLHGQALLDMLPQQARVHILARVHGANRCYFHKTDLAGWCAFSAPSFVDSAGTESRRPHAVGGSRHVTPHAGRFGGRLLHL